MAIFGYNVATNANEFSSATDNMYAVLSTPASNGTVSSMSVYTHKQTSGNSNAKCAIYTQGGLMLGMSDQVTISGTTLQWYSFTFSTPVQISVQPYLLAFFFQSTGVAGTSVSVNGDDPIAASAYIAYFTGDSLTYPNFPASVSFSIYDGTQAAWAIYATYTATGTLPNNYQGLKASSGISASEKIR